MATHWQDVAIRATRDAEAVWACFAAELRREDAARRVAELRGAEEVAAAKVQLATLREQMAADIVRLEREQAALAVRERQLQAA
eukprot:676633-Prymnesium_polylepis.1